MTASVLYKLKTKLLIDTRTQAVICTYTNAMLQHVNNLVSFIYTGKG